MFHMMVLLRFTIHCTIVVQSLLLKMCHIIDDEQEITCPESVRPSQGQGKGLPWQQLGLNIFFSLYA